VDDFHNTKRVSKTASVSVNISLIIFLSNCPYKLMWRDIYVLCQLLKLTGLALRTNWASFLALANQWVWPWEHAALRKQTQKPRPSQMGVIRWPPIYNISRSSDCKPENVVLERSLSLIKNLVQDRENLGSDTFGCKNGLTHKPIPTLSLPEPAIFFSPAKTR